VIGGLILNLKINISILAVGGSGQLRALYKNGDASIKHGIKERARAYTLFFSFMS
jgi:hypothetical protein